MGEVKRRNRERLGRLYSCLCVEATGRRAVTAEQLSAQCEALRRRVTMAASVVEAMLAEGHHADAMPGEVDEALEALEHLDRSA
jgi:hypothetical protein